MCLAVSVTSHKLYYALRDSAYYTTMGHFYPNTAAPGTVYISYFQHSYFSSFSAMLYKPSKLLLLLSCLVSMPSPVY